ncbi:MAG: hypothetical protein HY690_13400 [Chloroflexi bacterium]|nr:hypothetical protein [Chloroflexota bacterium]
MANELERNGLPTVLISNLRSVAEYMHVHRFVPGVAIPHLLGNPALPPEEERLLRLELVAQALELLETPVGSRQEADGRRQ